MTIIILVALGLAFVAVLLVLGVRVVVTLVRVNRRLESLQENVFNLEALVMQLQLRLRKRRHS
jgi:hypothetical protein